MKRTILVFGFLVLSSTVSAISLPVVEAPDAYIFPVPVESQTWKDMESRSERLATCSIPEAVIAQMSTRGLLQTCLEFPFTIDILFHGSLQDGVERIIADFNGLQALMQRKDAGREIMLALHTLPAADVDRTGTLAEQGEYGFAILYLETLLAQDSVLKNLTQAERRAVVENTANRLAEKSEGPDVYGTVDLTASAILIVRTMGAQKFESLEQALNQNSSLRDFLQTGRLTNPSVLDQILTLSTNYLDR